MRNEAMERVGCPEPGFIKVNYLFAGYDFLDLCNRLYCCLGCSVQHALNGPGTDWDSQAGEQLLRPIHTYVTYGK